MRFNMALTGRVSAASPVIPHAERGSRDRARRGERRLSVRPVDLGRDLESLIALSQPGTHPLWRVFSGQDCVDPANGAPSEPRFDRPKTARQATEAAACFCSPCVHDYFVVSAPKLSVVWLHRAEAALAAARVSDPPKQSQCRRRPPPMARSSHPAAPPKPR